MSEEGSRMHSEPIIVPRCPLCGKAREMKYRPFCSQRCSNVDLSRWFNGVYAVPAPEVEEEDSFDLDVPDAPVRRGEMS